MIRGGAAVDLPDLVQAAVLAGTPRSIRHQQGDRDPGASSPTHRAPTADQTAQAELGRPRLDGRAPPATPRAPPPLDPRPPPPPPRPPPPRPPRHPGHRPAGHRQLIPRRWTTQPVRPGRP